MTLLLAGCQSPTTMRPELSDHEIRMEEDIQQQMADESKAQGGRKKNWQSKSGMRKQFERVAMKVEEAGANVCRELGLPALDRSCYYYFDIRWSDDLNASADGKNVLVNAGMLRFLENDDELAAILGHELAHNMMGHLDAGKSNRLAGALVGMLLDGLVASQGISTGGAFGSLGEGIGHLHYSSDFEDEADYVGLYIMARAGYDPRKAPVVWRRMSLEDPDGIYNSTTHPSNAARFVSQQKTITEIEYKRKHRVPLLPDIRTEDI